MEVIYTIRKHMYKHLDKNISESYMVSLSLTHKICFYISLSFYMILYYAICILHKYIYENSLDCII